VAGLNRQELQETIRELIMEKVLVRDPIVTVDYSNLYVIILGDVGTGRVQIDRDKFTILDAIGSSGDLNITGQRTNVKVIRENYGKKTAYEVNLCSAEDLYSSPVYYLQQNDVIYVEMNKKEKRNSTVMGNSTVQPSFWMGLATFVVSAMAWFSK
jgi:polysaccharide export outer membrane protein